MTKKYEADIKEMEKVSGGMIYNPDKPPRTDLPLGTLKSAPKTDPLPDPIIDIFKKITQDDKPGGASAKW